MALQKIKNFLYRHKNKIIFTGAVITGTIFLAKYGQKKIREWQERETREFLERARKQQHFESTERTCNQTIHSLIPTLLESLQKAVDTEVCIMELKNGTTEKVQVWEKLKIMVFTRLSTLVYSSAMLTVMLRIQLNLIGGYLYKNTQIIDGNLQQNYLSLCHALLQNGVGKLSMLINKTVEQIVTQIDLKRQLSLYDIEQVFWAIQAKLCDSSNNVKNDPIQNMKDYIMLEDITDSNEIYDTMMKETVDLFESEEVRSLVTTCVNRGFTVIIDKLTDFYTPNTLDQPSSSNSTEKFVHPSLIKIHLAKLIPILHTFLTNKVLSDALIQHYVVDDKLKMLGANIYEAFSNN